MPRKVTSKRVARTASKLLAGVVRFAKASNPFGVLAEEAVKEFEAGKTMDLRDYAKKRGIKLDE